MDRGGAANTRTNGLRGQEECILEDPAESRSRKAPDSLWFIIQSDVTDPAAVSRVSAEPRDTNPFPQ